MSRTAVLRCAISAVLFGASAPAASELASDLSPFALAGLLYLGAALVVLPASFWERPSVSGLRAGARPLLIGRVAMSGRDPSGSPASVGGEGHIVRHSALAKGQDVEGLAVGLAHPR